MISFSDLIALVGVTTTTFMAGLLFVFSSCVMRTLRDASPAQGLAAMTSINRDIVNPIFGLVFVASVVAAIAAVVATIDSFADRPWLFVAGVVHLAGFLAVTATVHLPLNARFETLDASADTDVAQWIEGAARWTRFNHVRSAATILASIAYGAHLATQL